jgi:hypothetical protein
VFEYLGESAMPQEIYNDNSEQAAANDAEDRTRPWSNPPVAPAPMPNSGSLTRKRRL